MGTFSDSQVYRPLEASTHRARNATVDAVSEQCVTTKGASRRGQERNTEPVAHRGTPTPSDETPTGVVVMELGGRVST